MKKRMLAMAVVLAMCLSAVPTVVRALDDSDFQIENGELIAYLGSGGDVVIPEGVTTVRAQALDNANGCESISLPKSLISLPYGAGIVTPPKAFVVDPENSAFCAVDGVLFSKDRTKLIRCSSAVEVPYAVPAGVKQIEDSAFFNVNMAGVTLPEGLEVIRRCAFSYGPTELELPASLKKIETDAFEYCDTLVKITFLGKDVDIEDRGIFTYTIEGSDEVHAPDVYAPKGGSVEAYCTQNNIPFHELTVEPQPQPLTTDMFMVDTSDSTYTGSAITKTITSSLTEGTDYIISYSDNVNAGTATITINGIGNYSGKLTYTFIIKVQNSENIPQQMGTWNSYGNSSKKLRSVKLTTENERQQFVLYLLGQDYLEESNNTYKIQMYEKLYALLYTTNYHPDALGGFKAKWPFLNKIQSGKKLSNTQTGIGNIDWYRSCQGCYAYANFANQFFFDQSGKDASADKYTYYYYTFIGLNNVAQLKQSDITTEHVKAFIETFASPGEQIRFYHSSKGPLYSWTNMHSVLYLGENKEKSGFYALSYLGSNGYSGLEINFYDYSDFAASIGLKGLDTLRVLGNFRDPSNTVNYYNGWIKMTVRCPVEVKITYGSETLSSIGVEDAQSSFGTLKRDQESDAIIITLIYKPDYDITILGTGFGTMDLDIVYTDEDATEDIRIFKTVPIKETTNISIFAYTGENDTLLYLDPNSDGTDMEIWSASAHEISTGFSSNKMFSEGFWAESEPDVSPEPERPPVVVPPPTPRPHSVSCPVIPGGTVTASPASAVEGATITLTAVPEEGYELKSLTVTGAHGTVPLNGTSFTMPDEAVTVTAVFAKLPEPTPVSEVFTDIQPNQWFESAVQYVYDKGLMAGVAENVFDPYSSADRAMIVTILWRLAEQPAAEKAGFTDIAENSYYAEAVAWAAANGIVTGHADNSFRPNDAITREQLAAMIYRYAGNPAATGDLSGFSDGDKVGGYAISALKWAVEKGIFTGKGGFLDPKGIATRAEVAAVLTRFLTLPDSSNG